MLHKVNSAVESVGGLVTVDTGGGFVRVDTGGGLAKFGAGASLSVLCTCFSVSLDPTRHF